MRCPTSPPGDEASNMAFLDRGAIVSLNPAKLIPQAYDFRESICWRKGAFCVRSAARGKRDFCVVPYTYVDFLSSRVGCSSVQIGLVGYRLVISFSDNLKGRRTCRVDNGFLRVGAFTWRVQRTWNDVSDSAKRSSTLLPGTLWGQQGCPYVISLLLYLASIGIMPRGGTGKSQ